MGKSNGAGTAAKRKARDRMLAAIATERAHGEDMRPDCWLHSHARAERTARWAMWGKPSAKIMLPARRGEE